MGVGKRRTIGAVWKGAACDVIVGAGMRPIPIRGISNQRVTRHACKRVLPAA